MSDQPTDLQLVEDALKAYLELTRGLECPYCKAVGEALEKVGSRWEWHECPDCKGTGDRLSAITQAEEALEALGRVRDGVERFAAEIRAASPEEIAGLRFTSDLEADSHPDEPHADKRDSFLLHQAIELALAYALPPVTTEERT